MVFWGILLALFSTLLGQFLRFELGGGAVLFLDIFLPILFIFWMYSLLQKGKNIWNELRSFPLFWEGIAVLVIFFISLCLAGSTLSFTDFLQSGFYLFRYTFLFLFSIIVFSEVQKSPEKQRKCIQVSIGIAVLLAIGGFIQLFIYPDFSKMAELGWDPHIGRLLSTWFDPNFLGSFFSFILALMAGIFSMYINRVEFEWKNIMSEISQKENILFLSATIILLVALLLTFSRSAQLAFVLPIALLGIIYFRTLLFLGVIAIMLILPFSPRATERITDGIQSAVSLTESQSMFVPDPTARLRVENFEQGVDLASQNFWTGIGFNTIRLQKTENIHSAGGFDSSLLTVMVTSGVFGLIAFLFFYFSAWKKTIWRYLGEKSVFQKGLRVGFLASFLGIFAQSFFINSLFYSLFMIFFFCILGVSLTKSDHS